MIAQVIVDVVHENVDRPFSYLIPEGMELSVGSRVLVPLGRQKVNGFVTDILPAPPEDLPVEKCRPVMKLLDPYPALLPPLLSLAREMAEEHHCPLSETLRLMLPSAMRTGRIHPQTEVFCRLLPGADAEQAAEKYRRSSKKQTLLRLLSDGETRSLTELSQLVNQPRDALKGLSSDGLISLWEEETYRAPEASENVRRTEPPALTEDQRNALKSMLPDLNAGKGSFLLHGVTGSGKTEVYLAMVRQVLDAGKSAIILVPEISLTPQMVRWFCARFGSETAVLHSRLTEGQRYDEWRRIRLSKARVVVGARSAVFAPVEKLGLIVIDEEHETTYLSDKHPRYDARKVAGSRAVREGATLVLSSATPSILSFAMARRGDYTLVEMPRRVNDRPLPAVSIVDMRQELNEGNRSLFSRPLLQKMKDTLENGHQIMLFLNRRGYNTFVSCRNCGYVVKCAHCDLSMTLHRENDDDPGTLRCHMCGSTLEPPTVCPECGSRYIRYFGSGTQRVEDEVHRLFPGVETVRMDIDTTRERNAHEKLLARFGSGEAKVLIGTQMIAKGLDFPNVTLVGVVAADMTLNLPDYRAQERTFQLITQVAGRAGRSKDPGEVIVQTYKPDNACIQAASQQDYRSFFEMEFSRRRSGLYPPFTLLARMLTESASEEESKAMTDQLFNTLQTYLLSHPAQKKRVLMIRADEAPVKRIRGKYRYQVLLKLFDHPDSRPVTALMSDLCQTSTDTCTVYCEINPVTLM